jgi:hypothetical protein
VIVEAQVPVGTIAGSSASKGVTLVDPRIKSATAIRERRVFIFHEQEQFTPLCQSTAQKPDCVVAQNVGLILPKPEIQMRILSGIQSSGNLHIGNYFGMMRPAIALQAEGEAYYFIADYHALTSVKDPKLLRENGRRVAIDFLACGLDPDRATFFRQSDVPQVTELAWILSTVTPMGLLERAHSYKDKIARGMSAFCGTFHLSSPNGG